MSGVGHADLHQGPGQVAGEEGLLHHLGMPDGLDADVGAVAAGERPDRLDRVARRGVDGVGGAERRGQLELARVEVDGDDRGRAGELRAPAMAAHPTPPQPKTATVSPEADLAGEHGGAEPAITPHPSSPTASGRADGSTFVHWPAATSVLLGEGADAEGGGERRPVGQRHLLRGVVRGEAVPGPAPPARPALAADRPPVEDDEVARREVASRRARPPRRRPAASWPSRNGKSSLMPPSR